MNKANFCLECGERIARRDWRARLRRGLCEQCAHRFGALTLTRPIVFMALIAMSGFAIGRYVRPSPPPLIIQRTANSPLADTPVNPNDNPRPPKPSNESSPTANVSVATADDAVYICGARTQKGTPCRRRVHVAGERCFQHKGMAAMVPLEKLRIAP
jgi:hypothetical protein